MSWSNLVAIASGSLPARGIVNAAFHWYSSRGRASLSKIDPVESQRNTLERLLKQAVGTRFGRDHGFATIRDVEEFQKNVPLRTYEDLWRDYLESAYPVFDNLTWPGKIPYIALTSGTTTGATKYIPVSREMIASNRMAGQTMIAAFLKERPASRLFHGKLFFMGGASDLESPATGIGQGDLSAIAAKTAGSWLRPYMYPPLELALEPNWDHKLTRMAEGSLRQPITLVSGVTSCLVSLFQRVIALSGKKTVAEVWPKLEVVVHGGVKFDPYRDTFNALIGDPNVVLMETYACSEGFVAHEEPGAGLLRLLLDHGIFYEFVPVDDLGSYRERRHWLGDIRPGVNYAIVVSTCAGMWAHVIGDTVRFEQLDPPLLTFTGRTKYALSPFGEHLILEEVDGAVATASQWTTATVKDWHMGPIFEDPLGHHVLAIEFVKPPDDLDSFRRVFDAELSRRNAHYQWFRAQGGGLELPELVCVRPGGFDSWMRSRGKLGGQNKVPRMDGGGQLTLALLGHLDGNHLVDTRMQHG